MCIQAIAKLLTGDIGGACKAEASAWGLGGAGGQAGFCGTKGADIRAGGYYGERHGSYGCESGSKSGLKSHCGSRSNGHGGTSFEKTTTQTHVGADGSVTQKTTQISHSGAGSAGYGAYGYNQQSGYGGFGASNDVRYSGAGFNAGSFGGSVERSGAWNDGSHYSASGASGAGSFAVASVSITPSLGLSNFLDLFRLGASNARAA
jgi:hypothetical protein